MSNLYSDEEPAEQVPIPLAELEPDTLRAVVESFVLREGTDYGQHELTLEQKVLRLMQQLERREAQIVFDPNTDSVNIVKAQARGRDETR
jgi:uncharacterized protein